MTKFIASLLAFKDYCFPLFLFYYPTKEKNERKYILLGMIKITLKTLICNIDFLTY